MTLLILKIIFLLCLMLVSLSLITWYFKDLPGYIRKPLVLIIYIPSILPKLIISLIDGQAYSLRFWQDIKLNAKIAWKGHHEK